jgi:16S rRNA (cytosine967-C5)-methyltransferase
VNVLVEDGRQLGAKFPNAYDRVIVDAPCSGLGTLRRRPESRWRKSAEDLKTLTVLQYELLESARDALKPGGLLLYVTCSPHLSETIAVVDKAQKNLGLKVLDLTSHMNKTFMKGTLPAGRKTIQLYTHRDNTDCMFMALMTKD